MNHRAQELLRASPFFSPLDPAAFATLGKQCFMREFVAREVIINHRDESFDVLFLLTGSARVNIHSADGKQVSFRDIVPGAVFGELSAIDGQARSANVECMEPCVVAVLRQQDFQQALASHPPFMMAIMKHLAGQIRVLSTRVIEFSTLAVRNRLRTELLRMAEASAKGAPGAVLSPAPTHAEFATRISTHREAVTREFAWLEDQGLVIKQGRALQIPSLSALRSLTEGL